MRIRASLRRQLNFANVVSAIALFMALGGATAFAVVAQNQVVSSSIKDREVKAVDIAPNAVNGSKVADGFERTLRDRCPFPTNPVSRVACIDKVASGLQPYSSALVTCGNKFRRLPTISELSLANKLGLLAPNAGYWTDVAYRRAAGDGAVDTAVYYLNGAAFAQTASSSAYVACAQAPTDFVN